MTSQTRCWCGHEFRRHNFFSCSFCDQHPPTKCWCNHHIRYHRNERCTLCSKQKKTGQHIFSIIEYRICECRHRREFHEEIYSGEEHEQKECTICQGCLQYVPLIPYTYKSLEPPLATNTKDEVDINEPDSAIPSSRPPKVERPLATTRTNISSTTKSTVNYKTHSNFKKKLENISGFIFFGLGPIFGLFAGSLLIKEQGLIGLIICAVVLLVGYFILMRNNPREYFRYIWNVIAAIGGIGMIIAFFWLLAQGQGEEGDYCPRCAPVEIYQNEILSQ